MKSRDEIKFHQEQYNVNPMISHYAAPSHDLTASHGSGISSIKGFEKTQKIEEKFIKNGYCCSRWSCETSPSDGWSSGWRCSGQQ